MAWNKLSSLKKKENILQTFLLLLKNNVFYTYMYFRLKFYHTIKPWELFWFILYMNFVAYFLPYMNISCSFSYHVVFNNGKFPKLWVIFYLLLLFLMCAEYIILSFSNISVLHKFICHIQFTSAFGNKLKLKTC